MADRPTPTGRNGAVCARCHRAFTGVTAFDKHQDQRGGTTCHDPADKGLEITRHTPDGHPVWGQRMSEADRARFNARKAA